jgi:hypothetical protein
MPRFPPLVQRILVVAFAAVTCGWLVASLAASRELDQAVDLAAVARTRPIPTDQLARARDGLERARRWGVDDGSLYAEVGLLILAERTREARQVTERLVQLQPERFEAWRSLYGLTAVADPARANEARRQALKLNPRAFRALPPVSSGD